MLFKQPKTWYFYQACSLVFVALGQPALCSFLGFFSAGIGFALHWRGLDFLSDKEARLWSLSWFFLVQVCQLSWMSSISYQGSFFLLVYFFLAAGIGLQFMFFTNQLRKTPSLRAFSIASLSALWVLLEWSRLFFLCGFTFNFVGLSLASSILSLQGASLFGILGLSFWVMITNLLALKALREKRNLSSFLKWGIVLVLPYLYGAIHIAYHDAKKEEGAYQGLVIQTGLLPAQKYRLKGKEGEFISPLEQWERVFTGLSKKQKKKFDFIVFPEAAFPYGLDKRVYHKESVQQLFLHYFDPSIQESFPLETRKWVSNKYFFQTLARFFETEIVTGLDVRKDGKNYNSALLFNKKGEASNRYDKRILLPVAEYTPLFGGKGLSKLFGFEEFFSAGKAPVVWQENALSPSICYEELFSSLIREGRERGALLFVNLSNDAWYPSSTLAEQHFTQGLIRSIENGLPLVRSCNTGVSAAVDSLGREVARLTDDGLGFLHFQLAKYQYRTLFSILGQTPLIIFCFATCFLFFLRKKTLQKRAILGSV